MVWVDYAVLAIIVLSAVISLFRGFVREAISLLGWIVGIWVAFTYMDRFAGRFEPYLDSTSLRLGASFLALFAVVLLVTAVLNFGLGRAVDKIGLTKFDRVLGTVFGAARGGLWVGGLVLLAGLTAMPQDPWWQESLLIQHFQGLAVQLRELLPADAALHFKF